MRAALLLAVASLLVRPALGGWPQHLLNFRGGSEANDLVDSLSSLKEVCIHSICAVSFA